MKTLLVIGMNSLHAPTLWIAYFAWWYSIHLWQRCPPIRCVESQIVSQWVWGHRGALHWGITSTSNCHVAARLFPHTPSFFRHRTRHCKGRWWWLWLYTISMGKQLAPAWWAQFHDAHNYLYMNWHLAAAECLGPGSHVVPGIPGPTGVPPKFPGTQTPPLFRKAHAIYNHSMDSCYNWRMVWNSTRSEWTYWNWGWSSFLGVECLEASRGNK